MQCILEGSYSHHYAANPPPIQYILSIFIPPSILQFLPTIEMILTLPSLLVQLEISYSFSLSPSQPPLLLFLCLLRIFLLLLSLVCVVQLFLGVGPSLVCSQPSRGHTTKENWLFLFQQLSIARNSSDGGRKVSCPPFPTLCWDFIWMEFVQVLYQFLSSSALLFLEPLFHRCSWACLALTFFMKILQTG